MLTLGVDPGLHGALAVLDAAGALIRVADLPVISDRTLKWIDGGELQSIILGALEGRPATVMCERVGSMPKQGIASAFQFGVGFGSVLGVLQALHLPIAFVTPAVWKASYGLTREKHVSLHKARLMWPAAELHLMKHEGRGEALLLAEYGRRTHTSRAAA